MWYVGQKGLPARLVTQSEAQANGVARANEICVESPLLINPVIGADGGIYEGGEAGWGWKVLRSERDRLLSDSDKTQLPDFPISDQSRMAWADYRASLRDLPEMFPDATPQTIVWPEPPHD